MALDNLVCNKIYEEIKNKFLNGFISDIYKISKTDYAFLMHKVNFENKRGNLIISLDLKNPFIGYTNESLNKVNDSSQFFIFLKKLKGTKLTKIDKIKNERIFIFNFEKQESNQIDLELNKQFKMYIELFPNHPNILITDENNIILSLYKEKGDFLSDNFLSKHCLYNPTSDRKTLNECTTIEEINNVLSNKTFKLFSSLLDAKEENNLEEIKNKILNSPSLYIIDNTIQPYHFNKLDNPNNKKIEVKDIFSFYIQDQNQIANNLKEENLKNTLEKLLKQSSKKLTNLKEDYNKANNSLIYVTYGNYILSEMYKYNNQSATPNEIIYEPTNKIIELNKDLSLIENAQSYFKKYKKAKSAIEILQTLINKTTIDIDYFKKKLLQFEKSNFNDIQQMKEELDYLGYIKLTKSNKKLKKQPKQKQYSPHVIHTKVGTIFFGMNDLQNETLTFKIARKEDIFLHIKNYSGSHIVIKREDYNKNEDQTLKYATQLALYLSNIDQADIYYTQITKVKKNNEKLGLVNLREYKTIYAKKNEQIQKEIIDLIKNSNK